MSHHVQRLCHRSRKPHRGHRRERRAQLPLFFLRSHLRRPRRPRVSLRARCRERGESAASGASSSGQRIIVRRLPIDCPNKQVGTARTAVTQRTPAGQTRLRMRGSSVGASAWPMARLASPYISRPCRRRRRCRRSGVCRRSGQPVTGLSGALAFTHVGLKCGARCRGGGCPREGLPNLGRRAAGLWTPGL
jgi:hypothetical protein